MRNRLVTIDPGKNGGIAFDLIGVDAISMPETAHDIAKALADIVGSVPKGEEVMVVLERVHSMPTDAASAAFTFGENFGILQGVLAALKVPYRLVTPQVWQKKVGALPKDKAERKRALKAFAQQRYPLANVTLKTADALAMYAVESEA